MPKTKITIELDEDFSDRIITAIMNAGVTWPGTKTEEEKRTEEEDMIVE